MDMFAKKNYVEIVWNFAQHLTRYQNLVFPGMINRLLAQDHAAILHRSSVSCTATLFMSFIGNEMYNLESST